MTGIQHSLTDQNANFSWDNFIARFLAQLIYLLFGQANQSIKISAVNDLPRRSRNHANGCV